jgi:hypothetical protein
MRGFARKTDHGFFDCFRRLRAELHRTMVRLVAPLSAFGRILGDYVVGGRRNRRRRHASTIETSITASTTAMSARTCV